MPSTEIMPESPGANRADSTDAAGAPVRAIDEILAFSHIQSTNVQSGASTCPAMIPVIFRADRYKHPRALLPMCLRTELSTLLSSSLPCRQQSHLGQQHTRVRGEVQINIIRIARLRG